MAEQVLEPTERYANRGPALRPPAQEFADSRAFIITIHREEPRNPWVVEYRAEELAAAEAVFEQ